jgi:hypothetical protein
MASKTVPAIRSQSTHLAVANLAAAEMCRLWQAHGIIELAVHSIGNEVDNGRPPIKQALQGAADIVKASINELERICTPGDVAEVSHAVAR